MVELSSFDPFNVVSFIYQIVQYVISWIFSPIPPSHRRPSVPLGHVAIVGSGVTGISTAAHLVGHGFEVTIFEATDKVGGIWSRVNSTSGLQISSLMYRFFPAVRYTKGYPKRDEILDNIERVWKTYGLDKRTKFDTVVKSAERHESTSTDPKKGGRTRWFINGDQSVIYDAVVATVGTCGEPKKLELPSEEKFQGDIHHSSELDDLDLQGKRVLIVGGGASGIEALELAVQKGSIRPTILARSDKWIIPRFTIVDVMLSLQPFGRETFLSFVPEFLIRKFHYRDLEEKMAPTQGFYTGTPIVNTSALTHIRQGKADYIRGDVTELSEKGIHFTKRRRGTKPGDEGETVELEADIIVIATGFSKPKLDFLPEDLFPEDYVRPNMYLQNFPVTDFSVLCTNSTFKDAVGTVGNWHIGIYARILALFLMEESCRPQPRYMRMWVDGVRYLKQSAPGGALEFFTYVELCIWLVTFLFFRFSRLKYAFFVLFGFGFWARTGEEAYALDSKRSPPPGPPKFHLSLSKLVPHYRRKAAVSKLGGHEPVRKLETPSQDDSH